MIMAALPWHATAVLRSVVHARQSSPVDAVAVQDCN
jgi:hypothetical protein